MEDIFNFVNVKRLFLFASHLRFGIGFAPSGVISIEGIGQYSYTYDPYSENYNDLTLQDLSEDAQERFFQCARCPLPTYRLFLDYYGEFDYADWWLAASFDGTSTSFENGNAMYKPNANFSNFDLEGRGGELNDKVSAWNEKVLLFARICSCELSNS